MKKETKEKINKAIDYLLEDILLPISILLGGLVATITLFVFFEPFILLEKPVLKMRLWFKKFIVKKVKKETREKVRKTKEYIEEEILLPVAMILGSIICTIIIFIIALPFLVYDNTIKKLCLRF